MNARWAGLWISSSPMAPGARSMALKARMIGRDALLKKIREVVPNAEVEYAKAIEIGAKELAEAIRARAPRKTGKYAASIEAGKIAGRNDGRAPIGIQRTKDPHAWGIFADFRWRFIEFGTKGHIIKPNKARRLAFTASDGTQVYAARVKHPGSTRRPHIFPTYRGMSKRIRSRVARAINKSLKKTFGK
ncbi:HK97 gp10 family phage protein [Ancylobacter pratisalsi]|uniref:HK97 gp10 family phage protein n=1 Tax=Ancylobacter pratisalsi TaxID=1745854 RepID=UPI001FECBFBF|nr:HK97 gp10 family phage protein [Ancylobacter pratisalsi]